MEKIWIGIDPDVDKSGIAIWYKNELKLSNMSFFEIFTLLNDELPLLPVTVVIEAGWENKKSNWHYAGENKRVASRIGSYVGANHQVGKLLVEMCKYLDIDYELDVPKTSKLKAIPFAKLTKYKKRTNQEQRDAAMLVFGRT